MPTKTKLRMPKLPAMTVVQPLKSFKSTSPKRQPTPLIEGRVFVTLDGITLQPGQRLPGFRYALSKDTRQTPQIDTRLFFILCKEKLGVHEDLSFMFDTQGHSYTSIDQVPSSIQTLLVSPYRIFEGIKLMPSKSLFNDSEDEVQLPFKSRLNTSVARSSQRDKSFTNIANSSYEEIEVERLSNRPFISGQAEESTDLVKLPVVRPPSRASTSIAAIRSRKPSRKGVLPVSKKLKTDYVKVNISSVGNIHSVISTVDKRFPPLSLLNIPMMMKKYDFTRMQLHHLYAQYKSMLVAAVTNDIDYSESYPDLKEGVDRSTFIEFSQNGSSVFGKELSEKVFDTIDRNRNGTCYPGYIDWHEYLSAMSIVNVGTSETKIDLFFNVTPRQMYDTNRNGRLDFFEIKSLCKLQLKPNADESFVEDMGDFFTKLLFRIAGVPEDKEMEAAQLKQALLSDTESRNLVELFCCWHNNL
jgi:hypothetical protein